MQKIIIPFFMFLFSVTSWAQFGEEIEIEKTGISQSKETAQARKEIVDSVVREAAIEKIIGMIGAEKYDKNKQLIAAKVLRETGRFVPIIKNGNVTFKNGEASMPVQFRLSLKNLKTVLLEYGLLYRKEGLPMVFPFVQILDRIHGMNYKWWGHEPSTDRVLLVDLSRRIEKALKGQMFNQGFYAGLPTENEAREILPVALRNEAPSEAGYELFASFFGYDIYVDGSLTIEPGTASSESYRMTLHWVARYQNTHRIIAEVSRVFEAESGPFDLAIVKTLNENLESAANDLTVQLMDSWQKGTFGAALFSIVLRGPMSYLQLAQFKDYLLANAKYIKSVRERKFENQQVTLEADVTGGPNDLSEIIKNSKIESLNLNLTEIGGTSAIIDVITR